MKLEKLNKHDLFLGQVVYFYVEHRLESIGIVVELKGEEINVRWHDCGYSKAFWYSPMKYDSGIYLFQFHLVICRHFM